MSLPFDYLGIPIRGNSGMWEPLLKKIRKMLSRWKGIHLSFVGKISLNKFIIPTLSLFFLSFFKAQKKLFKISRESKVNLGEVGERMVGKYTELIGQIYVNQTKSEV